MSNDLLVAASPAAIAAHFGAVADDEGGNLAKFAKGHWATLDDEPLDDAEMVVDIAELRRGWRNELRRGWRKWWDGHIAGAHIGYVKDGFQPPERGELGDLDPTKWQTGNDGQPTDPWQWGLYLKLMDEKGDVHTWSATSGGARKVVSNLSRLYENRLLKGLTSLPTVRLGSTYYKHKVYGRVDTPLLEIIRWEGGDEPLVIAAPVAPKPKPLMTFSSGPDQLAEAAKKHATSKAAPFNDEIPTMAAG